jgi:hypothetical protein
MDKASESILRLRPITFRYKKEFDSDGLTQFGLVAEDVEKVCPDLVVSDEEGKPLTVRYDAVNAMLLNEFLKEHRIVEEQTRKIQAQEAAIIALKEGFQSQFAEQQNQLKSLLAGLTKVSAQIEANNAAALTVLNKR